jgi:cation diffusion facilitator CzcD-associated flavoprotein CzcO
VFGTQFVYGNPATRLAREQDRLVVGLQDGSEAQARAVVIATGVSYRRLEVPELEALVGAGVFYGAGTIEAQAVAGRPVFVVGGGNSAGQAALHLSKYAAHVTILIRSGPTGTDLQCVADQADRHARAASASAARAARCVLAAAATRNGAIDTAPDSTYAAAATATAMHVIATAQLAAAFRRGRVKTKYPTSM